MLSLLVFLPIVGMLLIWGSPARFAKVINVVTNAAVFILTIVVTAQVADAGWGYAPGLEVNESWIGAVNINYHLACDGLSASLLLLTGFVSLVAAFASWGVDKQVRGYHMMFLLLLTGMLGVFVAMDLFLFYLFWEIMLLPMYFLIGIWGGPKRAYASIKFFIYTLAGSVLLLAGMLVVVFSNGLTWSIPELTELAAAGKLNASGLGMLCFVGMFIGFAVKIPAFPFHTWLPDAHVQAPTPISMILAGVLLKMGGYGLMRIAYPFFPAEAVDAGWMISFLSVIAIVYGAFVAMAQTDFKKMIAYSSVSHMGFVTLGLASGTAAGINGGMYMMLAHGTISAMLFMIVGVIYDRAHHRDMDRFGGLFWAMPKYGILASFAFFASLGLPGMSGFIAEITTLVGAFQGAHAWAGLVALVGVVATAAYYLIALQKIYTGKTPKIYLDKTSYPDVSMRELAVLVPLAIVTLYMGIVPGNVMDMYEGATTNLESLMAPFMPGAESAGSATPPVIGR